MKDRSRIAVRPSPVIAGVFRVCEITKRSRIRGEAGFTLLLASPNSRYVAIAGQSVAHVAAGDLVRLKGCILRRGGLPVLVASSLDRVAAVGQDSRVAGLWLPISRKPWGGKSR